VNDLVSVVFPNHPWQPEKFIAQKGANPRLALQAFAQRIVASVFPINTLILSNWRAELVPERGHPLELDMYLPEYSLGIEYQVRTCITFLVK
jgi:hypothetical protein